MKQTYPTVIYPTGPVVSRYTLPARHFQSTSVKMSDKNGSTTGEKRKADEMSADTVTVKLSELTDLSNKAGT